MRPFGLAFLAFWSLEAVACGICIDDKVASCYDHAVVAKARASGHEVAFFAIDGPVIVNAENRTRILKTIQTHRGVLPGTARVSLENAALSFAYDPGRAERFRIAAGIEKALYARGLSLRFLRSLP